MDHSSRFSPVTCVINFHHARGPVVEKWFSDPTADNPADELGWELLPFFALPDKSHEVEEDISCFTLRSSHSNGRVSRSVFGISCTRHCKSKDLVNNDAEVTRASVQKAVVAIVDSPYKFSRIRPKLSAVTRAWFAGRDLSDFSLINQFEESIVLSSQQVDDENDQYFGLSLRQLLHEYRHQTLTLLKCCLLQPKMLFFGSHCEKLCLLQFALVSLIPGLLRNLQDSADPSFNTYEKSFVKPASLQTSQRASLLAFMGLPFQLFGKGSLFSPYAPLQQLETLADEATKGYIVGSMNNLLLMQRDKYCDVMINVDECRVDFVRPELGLKLALTASDRRWIDLLTHSVNETWDDANPTRPTTHGYAGSEEFIRLHFEEYLLSLASSVRYLVYYETLGPNSKATAAETYGVPTSDFGLEWVDAWRQTDNFRIFSRFTDDQLFDIIEPRHPCAGGLKIEDVQRRLAQQFADFHLDEKFAASRDTISKHFATGQQRVSSAFKSFWTDVEALRDNQSMRMEAAPEGCPAENDAYQHAEQDMQSQPHRIISNPSLTADLVRARGNIQQGAQKAGAYLSSWGSWASQVGKDGWKKAADVSSKSAATTEIVDR